MLWCALIGNAAMLFLPHLELGRAMVSLGRRDQNQAKLTASLHPNDRSETDGTRALYH
jgi:hypothetical protein